MLIIKVSLSDIPLYCIHLVLLTSLEVDKKRRKIGIKPYARTTSINSHSSGSVRGSEWRQMKPTLALCRRRRRRRASFSTPLHLYCKQPIVENKTRKCLGYTCIFYFVTLEESTGKSWITCLIAYVLPDCIYLNETLTYTRVCIWRG